MMTWPQWLTMTGLALTAVGLALWSQAAFIAGFMLAGGAFGVWWILKGVRE